jgi:hypothetical protein
LSSSAERVPTGVAPSSPDETAAANGAVRVEIDWSTAVVVPEQPLFELRVRVAPAPVEREWWARFNELAKRQALDVRAEPRWGAVELVEGTIIVTALEPEAHVAVSELLHALVARTNDELEHDRVARLEAERREAEERAERELIAEELTQRFRTAPSVQPSAEPVQPRPLRPFRAVR